MTVVAKTVAEFAAEVALHRLLVGCSLVYGEPVHIRTRRKVALVFVLPVLFGLCPPALKYVVAPLMVVNPIVVQILKDLGILSRHMYSVVLV